MCTRIIQGNGAFLYGRLPLYLPGETQRVRKSSVTKHNMNNITHLFVRENFYLHNQ